MNTERQLQEPHGSVSGRFRTWRLPDGRFQVLVDGACGFVIDFDGQKFTAGHDTGAGAAVSSADAWFYVHDHEVAGLIDALRNAPEGQPIVGLC